MSYNDSVLSISKLLQNQSTESPAITLANKNERGLASFESMFNSRLVSSEKSEQLTPVRQPTRAFEMTIQDYFKLAPPPRTNAYSVRKNLDSEPVVKPKEDLAIGEKVDGEILKVIKEVSQKYNVAPELVTSVIKAESNFNPNAVSSAGARGLMQLMPATAQELGVTNSFDIRQNIDGGVRYFRKMLDRFNNDPKLALAAYNAGPGAVLREGGIPPFRETQEYVKKIIADYETKTGERIS